jgi:hypothetical protein
MTYKQGRVLIPRTKGDWYYARNPGPDQVIELNEQVFTLEHIQPNEGVQLVHKCYTHGVRFNWWVVWWPRMQGHFRVRIDNWEHVQNHTLTSS